MFLAEQSAALVPAVYKQLAETNDWRLLAPEISVAVLSLVALLDGMMLKKREAWYTPAMLKFFLLFIAAIVGFVCLPMSLNNDPAPNAFGGLIAQHGGWYTDVARIFFLLTAFCVTHLTSVYLRTSKLVHNEYYHLILVATAAMMLLVQANHFVLFFIALETVAVTLYVLVGYNRNSAASLEAGVKYLITGGLSSSLLLAGIVLLYGLGGNTELNHDAASMDMLRFDHLQIFLSRPEIQSLPLVKAGVVLVLSGVAFKIGAFPFNVWVPDVYQGAPSPTTAFLTIGSKAAGVFALISLTVLSGAPFKLMQHMLVNILVPVAGLTLLFGNITALGQVNVKRLLGLSGISHAGFLLIGVLAAIVPNDDDSRYFALISVVAYLFVYLFSSTLVFGVVGHMAGEDDSTHAIIDYRRLYERSPFLSFLLAIGVGSLAGIPPTLGFITKLLILIAAFKAGLYGIVAVALVGVVMGMYYYLTWLREAFTRVKSEDAPAPVLVNMRSRIILSVIALVVLFGFIAQIALKLV
jgi:NADH-quinone oxidoreductase subunit N